MKKTFLFVLILGCIAPIFGQFSTQKIVTDSSEIEIIRNSVYKIWEETFKHKDSIFYSVRYINDTSLIKTQGWERKNGEYFGRWVEYSPKGIWLCTKDYDTDTWKFNDKEYPYQGLLDSMKQVADNIIIKKYGLAFFRNNIRFKFHGYTYIDRQYLGNWDEPIKIKPNTFALDYTVKLDNKHLYYGLLRIELDSIGNIIDQFDSYEVSFQGRKVLKYDKFKLTYNQAIEICKQNGLQTGKEKEFSASLIFGFSKRDLYAGEYYFMVTQKYDEKTDGDCKRNCLVTKYYNVWRINPWTSELFFNKKMKQETSWTPGCGVTGNFIELDKKQ